MIESVVVRNFRCFERLELHGLKRLNLIVGRNSSGKTALLESVFLAAGGTPEIALRFRAQRSLVQRFEIAPDRKAYESLWKDLFFSLDQSRVITAQLLGTGNSSRSVSVAYKKEASLTLPLSGPAFPPAAIVPIVFEWRDHLGQLSSVEVKLTEQGLVFGGLPGNVRSAFFSTSGSNATEMAQNFSELSKESRLAPLVNSLRREFPHIEGLSLEINAGANVIYAQLSALREKLPLGAVSGGVNKLFALLLAIAHYSGGVILVDEIENGFYHDRLPAIWSSLLRFSKEFDTQVFASTHSLECLRSVLPCLKANDTEFALIRTEVEDRACSARVFGGRDFEAAIEQEVEVR
jgi:hypothetical protein